MRQYSRSIAALGLVAIGTAALAPTSVSAAQQAYIRMQGQKQGKYKGETKSPSIPKPADKPTTPSPAGARHR